MELALAQETLARWQFGITTLYHFLFVPLTISLAALVAALQTAWYRTGAEKYFHATKFWGKLFLINIAMGVVTGIVQEFQFGMNWSEYSRFVGDVFGAPLAMEALLAFFFESTFIGLWIFGWDRLPRAVHLACIWIVFVGTLLSAYFILAANSWMQHPVGFAVDRESGKARLTDIGAVLSQNTAVTQFFHTLTAAFLAGGAFVVGIAAYQLRRARRREERDTPRPQDPKTIAAMRASLRVGLVTLVIAGMGTAISGDRLGKVMYEQQPMKMAAAEALWESQGPAPFSVFAVGDVSEEGVGHNKVAVEVPGLLSFLAHSNLSETVPGVNDVARQEAARYGGEPADYIPNIFVTYWGFRLMIGFGMVSMLAGLVGLWTTRQRWWIAPALRTGSEQVPRLALTRARELGPRLSDLSWRLGTWTLTLPLVGISFGWLFTEMGRQPWVVFGELKTAAGVSPGVGTAEVVTSMTVFTLLYAVLALIEVRLLLKYVKAGPDTEERAPTDNPRMGGPREDDEDADQPLTFAY
ncbi:cytochrome ubiquinol oxidase subunit I [Streptomyces sp. NPDC005438]|uniref:cytochrome ubiquinol oxidase subunit I n=1 Tax=Streptomyces sp. NPDC005438 TaxID=3156880 RepID=UPI00339F5ACA